jgi:hypothetical protein
VDPNTKRFLKTQMVWIAISLAISFGLSLLLPFPYSLVAIIGVFLAMNYFMRQMRRMGMRGGGFFGTGQGSMFGQRGIRYVCIMCGAKHNGGSCPNCGSKLKKASFED